MKFFANSARENLLVAVLAIVTAVTVIVVAVVN